MTPRVIYPLIVGILLMAAGCGEREYKVTGMVTFDGKPIENGSIVFESAEGGAGLANAGISNGKYELQSKVGKKKVIISANRVRPGTEKDIQPSYDAYIPTKYNTDSELTKEVMPTENRFDFDLKK